MKLATTWAQICKIKGIDTKLPFDVSKLPKKQQDQLTAAYQLPITIEVLNADIKPVYAPWIPDYTNYDQPKYEIWFEVKATAKKPSGVGLACRAYGYRSSASGCGPRFAFRSREIAKHAFTHFKKMFEDHYLI